MTRNTTAVGMAATLLLSPAIGRADVVLDWNAIALTTMTGQSPFAQARFGAITQLAVFEAVNAITGHYQPYLGTITAPPGASAEAAAVAAAHGVLRNYFPGSAASLDAARAGSLASIPAGPARDDGIAVGEAAASAMIALRANDGAGASMPYTPLSGPGFWQPTPPAFGPAILQHWGHVTPFGILSGDQFRADPPPALTSRKYTRDYGEVQRVGGVGSTARPQDRADVARFYAVAVAPVVWNQIAGQASAARPQSLSENARVFALVNMALSDGLVSSQETKYFYHFWRPVTAIRAGAQDGNPLTQPDAGFTPFITTPSFPSYPSAHASGSYAARAVLERLFGRGCHAIVLASPAMPGLTLYYTSFSQITDDIDDARVYGGIHFRFDQEAGGRQGRRVGAYVCQHNLRPLDDDDDESDDDGAEN